MAKNKSLGAAKKAKEDEFYTQRSDIENELHHYASIFGARWCTVTVMTLCPPSFGSSSSVISRLGA